MKIQRLTQELPEKMFAVEMKLPVPFPYYAKKLSERHLLKNTM